MQRRARPLPPLDRRRETQLLEPKVNHTRPLDSLCRQSLHLTFPLPRVRAFAAPARCSTPIPGCALVDMKLCDLSSNFVMDRVNLSAVRPQSGTD